MDMPIRLIGIVCIAFSLIFMSMDIFKNQEMIQSEFEANRLATQGSLRDLQEKYNDNEELSSVEMLNTWLTNFVNAHGITYEKLKLGFVQIETDPPLYLVTVEGYKDEYALLSGEAYVKYTSGATIISKEEEKNEQYRNWQKN